MRKTVLSGLIVALLLGAAGFHRAQPASAAAPKPLAVVSLSGYDELKGDLEMVGRIVDDPTLAARLEGLLKFFTKDKGLAGLDKTKPLGAAIFLDGEKPSGYAFLPVSDFDQLLDVLKPYIGELKDLGDGMYEASKGRKPAYLKVQSGWVFVSDRREMLADVPADPAKLLAGLDRRYDLGIRFNAANVPDALREKLLGRIKKDLAKELERKPGEDDLEYALRKGLAKKLLGGLATGINDLDQVTFGLALDHKAETAMGELSVTAVEGSKTAKALEELGNAQTAFAGFRLPGAVLTIQGTSQCTVATEEELAWFFDKLRTKVFEEIDEDEKDEEKAKVFKHVIGGLLEVCQETIAAGKVDGAGSVVLRPDAVTLVGARHVADGPKLESALAPLVPLIRKKAPEIAALVAKTKTEEFEGVRLHSATIRIPEKVKDRDKLVRVVGENPEVVLGIGPEAVYVAAGKDALKTLKQAIKRSAERGPQPARPLEVTVSLGALAKFIAEIGDEREREKAARAVAALEKAPDTDHVKLVVLPIPRGLKIRLEVEQGVLRMIGAMK
ncbi:MAG TPA: hypothetical protein VMY42_23510 [Thermoguttaceae bacterium]|nr:hypothetical protein [Thermoguttaceae bacterium]